MNLNKIHKDIVKSMFYDKCKDSGVEPKDARRSMQRKMFKRNVMGSMVNFLRQGVDEPKTEG